MTYTNANHLAHEWHSKNEKPISSYKPASRFRAWWKCSVCEHEWQSTIANRVYRQSKCPQCKKVKSRGSNNVLWTGFGEISGRHWSIIYKESHRRRAEPLEFTITIEYAWELFLAQDRKCVFTGKPLTMWGKKNGKYEGTASLDRIDSTKGYVEGNVQWVHKELQHMKRNLPDKEFIRICEEVAAHQKKQKKLAGVLPPSFKEWTLQSAL